MHPAAHLLAGWTLAEVAGLKARDRALVTWASVIPDIDGLGMLIDYAIYLLELPATDYYETYHRVFGHRLPAAVLFTIIGCTIVDRKFYTTILIFLSYHMHLLFDVVGSRGSNPADIWTLSYFAPISGSLIISWEGQWPLTSWQNTTFTIFVRHLPGCPGCT